MLSSLSINFTILGADDAVIKAFLDLVMELGTEELINDLADSKVRG
jgi:hypothetical protein